ncbi:LytR/AlgR family response regulator transcription factor [Floricoccus penangensis]|uniref:LytR/AlgR family response regulator transcription factor n=1 Tax=Floricoccus penangensis TaxID=1859475 RepID=UPI00203FBDE8|nr:LytTR family DNA-binding domain-containing protein [Floricoccus penangensis]URZ88042.1 LytTR family DNA-binding domain-containing protein [Floricoccus penangensis]
MSFPIIICEDSKIQLDNLQQIIDTYISFHGPTIRVDFASQNPLDVINYIDSNNTKNGIYFLDVDLNSSLNGIDLAEIIRQRDVNGKIIFVTSYEKKATLTLKRKIEALGFISKNQDYDDFRTEISTTLSLACERMIQINEDRNKNFKFTVAGQVFNINIDDILFFEPSDIPHRLYLYTKKGRFDFYGKLLEIEENENFYRISRSCVINPINAYRVDFLHREVYFDESLYRRLSIKKIAGLRQILSEI